MTVTEIQITKEEWLKRFSHSKPNRIETVDGFPKFHYKYFSSFGESGSAPLIGAYYIVTVVDWVNFSKSDKLIYTWGVKKGDEERFYVNRERALSAAKEISGDIIFK